MIDENKVNPEENEVTPEETPAPVEDAAPAENPSVGEPAEPSAEPSPAGENSVDSGEKPKKKRGYVRYSPLALVLLAVCAFVFSFSMMGLLEQALLDTAGEGEKENLSGIAFPDSGGEDDGGTGGFVPTPGPDTNKWQSIKPEEIDPNSLSFLQTVDFGALKAENSDTVAWMYWPSTADVKGLPFNLPVVQGINNEYYLTRSFDRSNSDNGWIYADYRNDLSDLKSNRNLIFYGHARSYLIFGGLKYLNTKAQWQQDGYNHFIYVNTPNERSVWQVFAWYETTVDFNYINTYFSNDAEYVEFLNTLQSKNTVSAFEEFKFSAADRILTLSTCKGNDENVRVAIHAVLVKHEILNAAPVDPGATDTDSADDTGPSDSFDTDEPVDSGPDAPPEFSEPSVSTDTSSQPSSSVPGSSSGASSSQPSTDSGSPSDTGSLSGSGTPSDSLAASSGTTDSSGTSDSGTPSNSGTVSDTGSSDSASTGGDASASSDGGTASDTPSA